MRLKIKFNTRHKGTGKDIGICTNKRNNIILIYTSEVRSSSLHACNILAVVDILWYIHKISLHLAYCNWRRLNNLLKERKILQNTFLGNTTSKTLKWILEPLKFLICSEDTEFAHHDLLKEKTLGDIQYKA